MKKTISGLAVIFLLGCTVLAARTGTAENSGPRRAGYLAYARASADWAYAHRDEILARWRESFDPLNVFGYRGPGGLLETAAIYAYLYEKDRKPAYAERAKAILMTYGDFRSAYPESSARLRPDYAEGVPGLPDFFTAMRYIRAYETLHRLGRLSEAENAEAERLIAGSMRYLLTTQEWGPMNRSALRAETLAWAVRALPGHPQAPLWEMQRRALGDDNWGAWEIEDAMLYNGVWLYALLGYADATGRLPELFRTPEFFYYARYFVNLMSPAGMIPDFGDSHWQSNWAHFLVFFEAAAARLHDPACRWAAGTIAARFVDFSRPQNVGLGYMLLDAYRWGSDDLAPAPPAVLSRQVLEDIVGKKIVFRNGWSPASTYALLNYRDEGEGGLNFRDYLRDTIPVEEEKMTHGHADENSLVLLMSGGSVLLHDGGYRDYMPSGPFGAYRQDYFHNRLCVRPEKIWMGQREGESRYSVREAVPGQGLLEFLRDAGSYRRVRTQKVDFLTFPDFDYSRTRLIDDGWGFQADRVVVYVKDPECFVVFDVLKALREGYFTASALWHTQKIHAQGSHWYDIGFDSIGKDLLPGTKRLLLVFPATRNRLEGSEPEKRHAQVEWLIHQTASRHFELGGTDVLTAILLPHAAEDDPGPRVEWISPLASSPEGTGAGVRIRSGGKDVTVGIKLDLRMDIGRDRRRPRYTYEHGRVGLGDFETNGDFLFASLEDGTLAYTVVDLTAAFWRGRPLVQAPESLYGLAFDGSPDAAGVGKLRYWRDKVDLK